MLVYMGVLLSMKTYHESNWVCLERSQAYVEELALRLMGLELPETCLS